MSVNVDRRIWWIGLVILAGALLLVAFRDWRGKFGLIGHLLLFSLYIIAVGYFTNGTPSKSRGAGVLLFISIVPQLLVIDPIEPGLYGRDTYGTLIDSVGYFDAGLIDTIIRSKSWPLFQSFIVIIPKVTGVELMSISKWIPLITIGVPVIVFLFSARFSGSISTAFYSGYSVAVLKTYLSYQTKFVDTSIGFILFTTIFLLWGIGIDKRKIWYCIIIAYISLILSHPMVSLLLLSMLLCLYIPDKLARLNSICPNFVSRLLPKESGVADRGLFYLLGFSVLYIFYYFFLLSDIPVRGVLVPIITPDSGYSTPATVNSPQPNVPSEVLTDYGLLAFVFALGVLLFILTISTTKFHSWEFGLEIILGVLSIYIGMTLFMTKVIGYDPSRIWFYFIPLLILVSFNVFSRYPAVSKRTTHMTIIILILFFALTQSFSMPYHVLYSSPDTTVPDSDHNPTIEGQAAVSWGIEYQHMLFNDLGFERINKQRSELLHKLSHSCPHPLVSREDLVHREIHNYDLTESNVVYTSGKVNIASC